MDAESLVKELILKSMTPEQQEAILASVKTSVANARAIQKQKIGENVDLVVQALKKIESDIRSRYDDLGNLIEKRVASIQDGRDGINGTDGRDGRDGKPGKDGAMGRQGAQGPSGKDGIDGIDGVSVENAYLDFDGGLVIKLSNGNEINVGEIMPMELASQIKVITNGGGTSQYVLDTLASLQTQINTLIPSQTGNSGKYLTTNGTTTSWGSVAGGLNYEGTWNASTNSPTLASSVGTNGDYYIVGTAGSTNLNGITDWQIGDWLLFNGTVWQKLDQTNLVTSVAGRTGAVTLSTSDISGTVAVANGGTGLTSLTAGYIPFGAGTSAFGNSANLFWNSASNLLGIGTSSPASKLHVVGDIQQDNANYLKGKLAAGTATRLFGLNSGNTLYIGSIDANHTGGTLFVKNGSAQMTLDASGNLGIGTSSPGGNSTNRAVLAYGSTSAAIKAQSSVTTTTLAAGGSEGYIEVTGAYPLEFFVNSAERFRIGTAGQLGIGGATYGTSGQVLTSGGASAAPTWGAVSLTSQVSGTLPVANGGTGTTTPSIVAGTNITVTGTWPNQTIASSGGGSGAGNAYAWFMV